MGLLKSFMPFRQATDIDRYARSVAGTAGIKISYWDNDYPTRDGDRLYLPRFTNRLTYEQAVRLRYFTAHEATKYRASRLTEELRRKEFPAGANVMDSPVSVFSHYAEGARIDALNAEAFAGDKVDTSKVIGDSVADFKEFVTKQAKGSPVEDSEAALMAGFEALLSMYGNITSEADFASLLEALPDEAKEMACKLEDSGIGRELRAITKKPNDYSTADVVDTAERMARMLYGDDTVEQTKQPEGGEKEDSSGTPSAGKSDQEEEEQEDKAQGSGDNDGDDDEEEVAGYNKEFVNKTITSESFMKHNPLSEGRKTEYKDEHFRGSASGVDMRPVDSHTIIRMRDNKLLSMGAEIKEMAGGRHSAYHQMTDDKEDSRLKKSKIFNAEDGGSSRALANKIRRVLQVSTATNYQSTKRHGSFQRKNMYRAALPMVGTGDYNKKIFKRPHKGKDIDTAITLLIDYSGSMSGSKLALASRAGILLCQALAQSLRVPVELITFTCEAFTDDTLACIIKEHDERASTEKLKTRFHMASQFLDQNDDGSAVMIAYDRLRRRSEKRKILIVLSDGSPAGVYDAPSRLTKTIKLINYEGRVELYGIGIEDDNVAHFYKDHRVINDVEELEPALLAVVRKKLVV